MPNSYTLSGLNGAAKNRRDQMEKPQTDVISNVANYSMRAKLMGHGKEGTVCQSLAMDASPHNSISRLQSGRAGSEQRWL